MAPLSRHIFGAKGPVINYREKGELQTVGGGQVLPLKKQGGKCLAMLKAGCHTKFMGSFNIGA